MKKIVLSFVFLFSVFMTIGQITRQMVVVEDGTGTWCTYCPGAAMGCDDLLSNGKYVAVIANHNGDTYANTYSNARNTMYGISAYPSCSFDGIQGMVGGSHTASMYSYYIPKYNACYAIPSPATMTMDVSNTGLDYTAIVTITKIATITSTNNVLYFFVTQSHVNQNWQGQTHLEHINRLMVPDQNGTSISFASGDVQTVTLHFTLSAAWPVQDCEFIAFVQNKDAGQGTIPGTAPYSMNKFSVLQGMKRGVVDLSVDFSASSTQIVHNSTVDFTNATTGGYIGVPETYEWQFPGGVPNTSTEKNPSIVYPDFGTYDVILTVNRGGQIVTITKPNYIDVTFGVGIENIQNNTSVYPNPNDGKFNIEVSGPFTVKVSNILGEVVYENNNCMNIQKIDAGLKPGTYLVKIKTTKETITKKIVVN